MSTELELWSITALEQCRPAAMEHDTAATSDLTSEAVW